MSTSGFQQAQQSDSSSKGGGGCSGCHNPSEFCICGGKPSEATVAMPGKQTVLEAAFGSSSDEHGSEMFRELRNVGRK